MPESKTALVDCLTCIWGEFSIKSSGFQRNCRISRASLSNQAMTKETRKYRKIPKISLGAYVFQRLFLRGLFIEGLIFGGAYLRREIDWGSLIVEGWVEGKFTVFALFYFVIEGNFPSTSRRGGLYLVRRFNGCVTGLGGLFSEFYGNSSNNNNNN